MTEMAHSDELSQTQKLVPPPESVYETAIGIEFFERITNAEDLLVLYPSDEALSGGSLLASYPRSFCCSPLTDRTP